MQFDKFISESLSKQRFSQVLQQKPLVSGDEIYEYIRYIHNDPNDFYDGDLSDRIESYDNYKLENVKIDDIDCDEFFMRDYDIPDFIKMYKNGSEFPIIVLSHDYRVIDGTHRCQSAKQIGLKMIKAYVGVR